MTAGLWISEKKGRHGELGAEGHHHEHSLQKLPLPTGIQHHVSRCDSRSALSYREHLPWIVVPTESSRLALFTPNSGEGLLKVRINASRVTKRMIEDRFHLKSLSLVCVIRTCHANVLFPDGSKMRSWLDEVTLVQRLGQGAIFPENVNCKVARHPPPGYRNHIL